MRIQGCFIHTFNYLPAQIIEIKILGVSSVLVKLRNLLLVLSLGVLASGCATGRGEVDVKVAETANPAAGIAVKILEISDKRLFEISPKQPSVPSLKNKEDYENPEVKARAIARKRNSYGIALGDIVLPEGKTVSQLVQAALENGLKESGYHIVNSEQSDYENVLVLEADITEYWAWFNPGFWSVTATHRARVELIGDWPLINEERTITGEGQSSGMAITTKQWQEALEEGTENLSKDLQKKLKQPGS
ncbi:hypothetical protein O4H49_09525 [Kiloniella laminariae]|uniref:Flagellar biosynthesis protein n=1 Tax=Kiloniella laminariae TaxID=454162 RepID=A0ABT4LIW3_9PROT|nr:hypothetical protein [Kiloniella laminariae]MCZ4281016.1 hypothetical protein [Kiloniella laminariae]